MSLNLNNAQQTTVILSHFPDAKIDFSRRIIKVPVDGVTCIWKFWFGPTYWIVNGLELEFILETHLDPLDDDFVCGLDI